MINSKFSIRYWSELIISISFVYLLLAAILDYFFAIKILVNIDYEVLSTLIASLIFSFIFFPQILFSSTKIYVDNLERIITFKNSLLFSKRRYNLNEFQGYILSKYKTRFNTYQVIYLTKNNKPIELISGFTYSNFNQLEESLQSLKNLGYREFDFFEHCKLLFRFKITQSL
jgi:hypothetical protein